MFDCCMINNEVDILDIRLNSIYDVVEKFVIIESNTTHSGIKKDTIFFNTDGSPNQYNRQKYCGKHLNKIIFLLYNGMHEVNPWVNERLQRETILKSLDICKPKDDFLFISDVDEIPEKEKLLEARYISQSTGLPCSVVMDYCMYFLNYSANTPYWGPYIYSIENHKKTIWRDEDLTKMRWHVCSEYKYEWPHLLNCGWHFSTIGSINDIQYKLKSYAHVEFSTDIISSKENIQKSIDSGKPYFEPLCTFNDYKNLQFKKRDLDFLPKYVIDNVDKFKKYIL